MEISYCNLKRKEVINVCDGKNLGNIYDMIIDTCTGKIQGIVLPINKNFFSIFKSSNDLFIPYNRICKIGKDIILVDIIMHEKQICSTSKYDDNYQTNSVTLENTNKTNQENNN